MGNVLAPYGGSLYDAIAEGNADAAVEVLQAHPDLMRKRLGSKKRSLYHFCAISGQVTVLKSLCEHVLKTVPDDSGVLLGAQGTKRQHPAIQQYINSCDQKGLTPLSLACKKGHAQVVTFLLSQGADPWVKDRMMGRTALHHAARANHPNCIEAILSHLMVKQVGGSEVDSTKKLVDHSTNSGYTPLHYAAAAHSREAAAALLRHGASPNAKTWEVGFEHIQLDRGSTPLHAAARYHSLDVAVLLLRYWDENLRGLDVTDPRVVENLPRIKAHQLPGVKLNTALLRVLDPGTPLREIREWYGDSRISVPSCKVPATSHQRNSTGLQRQDSELSKLSCSGCDGAPGAATGEPGLGESNGSSRHSVERSSPSSPRAHRQAISGAARQACLAATVLRDPCAEPVRTSRDETDGPLLRDTATADRSSRRSLADANIVTASPFLPRASAAIASATATATATAVPFGSLPLTSSNGDNLPDRSPDWIRSAKRPALPTPAILNPPPSSASPSNGTLSRSRSGAVFPMPPPAGCPGPSPAPQLLRRATSLQNSPGATVVLPAGPASPSPHAATPGSDDGVQCRQQLPPTQPQLDTWVSQRPRELATTTSSCLSPTVSVARAGCGSKAAYPGQMPLLAVASSSLGFAQDEMDCGPSQPLGKQQQQQQQVTLSARLQRSVGDGNALRNGSGFVTFGRSGDASTGTSATPSAAPSLTTAWQDSPIQSAGQLQQGTSIKEVRKTSSGGGRALARTLSKKLSLLAAHATGGAASVRHDSVRAASPEHPAPFIGRGGGSAGGRNDVSSPALFAAPPPQDALPGWGKPTLISCSAGGVGVGGAVPPPSVRMAF